MPNKVKREKQSQKAASKPRTPRVRRNAEGKAGEKPSSKRPIRVVVADDHPLIVEGLKLVLGKKGIQVVGEAATGRQAVEQTLALEPDVLLLDIRMPDMDGLEALASIKSARPRTSVLVLTSFGSPEYLARAVTLGAAGFLSKSSEPEKIHQAVRAIAAGETIVERELLQSALRALIKSTRASADGADAEIPDLTPQEIRILTLVAQGTDNTGIAELLCLSRNTIKSHVHNIFTKLGVSDRTQAAVWAMRHGLVSSL
ncbi:MAG: response regulator transcription factor [Thermoleophilia bacterium]|nr:response regulator transcription factor [Thermoleophilia bacterium]